MKLWVITAVMNTTTKQTLNCTRLSPQTSTVQHTVQAFITTIIMWFFLFFSESTFSLRYLDATCCSFENDTLLCLLLVSRDHNQTITATTSSFNSTLVLQLLKPFNLGIVWTFLRKFMPMLWPKVHTSIRPFWFIIIFLAVRKIPLFPGNTINWFNKKRSCVHPQARKWWRS